jgi:hypothetical protein
LSEHSRGSLFLIEQLVVILIFAICSAICVSIFAESYLMQRHTLATNNAIRVAANVAEIIKASGSDFEESHLAEILGAVIDHSGYDSDLFIYYNEDWNPSRREQASFSLRIKRVGGAAFVSPPSSVIFMEVSVNQLDENQLIKGELFSLTVASREGERR